MQTGLWHLPDQLPVNQFKALPVQQTRLGQSAAVPASQLPPGIGRELRGTGLKYSRHRFSSDSNAIPGSPGMLSLPNQ